MNYHKKTKKLNSSNNIIFNKRAYYEFSIQEEFEAGIVLQGWEVKSLRAGRVNISCSYVFIIDNEAYLLGANFQPLAVACSHINYETTRNRKLLLNQREIHSLYGDVNRKGYTIIALSLYWKKSWIKLKIATARGKTIRDKRNDIKTREWKINKDRIMKKLSR